ncbi:MAG: thioredoxin [Cyanobacteria bacterium J06642_2]
MGAEYIKEADFSTLKTEEKVVVIDFTAAWCGPCKLIAPLIDRLAEEYTETAKVVKFDIDENRDIPKKLGIRGVPAVLYFKAGEMVDSIIGSTTYEKLSATLDSVLTEA